MAKTKDSLRDVSDGELFDALAEAKEELFNLRFQHVTGQLDNTARPVPCASRSLASTPSCVSVRSPQPRRWRPTRRPSDG
jgi:hypothetical protein